MAYNREFPGVPSAPHTTLRASTSSPYNWVESLQLLNDDTANAYFYSTTTSGFPFGAGTRFIWASDKKAFRVGEITGGYWDTFSLGQWSFASGYDTQATNNYTVALGYKTQSLGLASFSIGYETVSSGNSTVAVGTKTKATGSNAFAGGVGVLNREILAYGNTSFNYSENDFNQIAQGGARGNRSSILGGYNQHIDQNASDSSIIGGQYNTVSSIMSFASGYYLNPASRSEFVIGQYNIPTGSGNINTWDPNDPLFICGNGSSLLSQSNAFVVFKNGVINLYKHISNPTGNTAQEGSLLYNTTSNTLWYHNGTAWIEIVVSSGSLPPGTVLHSTLRWDGSNWVESTRFRNADSLAGQVWTGSTTETGFPSGASTRQMFIPDLGAFRTGIVSGSEWDALNIGYNSFASGEGTQAVGVSSVALNYYSQAVGDYASSLNTSVALGTGSFSANSGNASGLQSAAFGQSFVSGSNSLGTGNATISGSSSIGGGFLNTSTGNNSFIMGSNNQISGDNSVSVGVYTFVSGYASFGGGSGDSVYNIIVSGEGSFAWGKTLNVSIQASGQSSAILGGYDHTASGYGSVVLGGLYNKSLNYGEVSIGRYNLSSNTNNTVWNQNSSIFTIGNGISDIDRRNAFVIYADGKLMSAPNHLTGRVWFKKSDASPLGAKTGLTYIADRYALRLGEATIDDWDYDNTGINSIASGIHMYAYGNSSSAFGQYTQSIGAGSHTTGQYTIAGGQSSEARGIYTQAGFPHRAVSISGTGPFTVSMPGNRTSEFINGDTVLIYDMTGGTGPLAAFVLISGVVFTGIDTEFTVLTGVGTQKFGTAVSTSRAIGAYASGIGLASNRVQSSGIGSWAHMGITIASPQKGAFGDYSGILGGINHRVDSQRSVIVGGNTQTLTQDDTVLVPRLRASGGMQVQVSLVSTNTILGLDHYYISVDTSSAITLTLPTTPITGQTYIIKDATGNANTNNITVDALSNLIDNANTYILSLNYASITLTWNSVKWLIH